MLISQSITFATAVAASMAVAAAQDVAQAQQNFPSKPVRIVVGLAAGSQSDIVARMIGRRLSEIWGQPVVVENRVGAGGTLGAAVVAKATPDGHTLLLASSSFVISAALHSNLPYDPLRDFAGITQLGFTTGVLVVGSTLGVKSVKDLIALAQARPGKIFYGSAGAGSSTHMSAERFKIAAGINTVHVGFKGQQEFLIEILAGRIHYAMAGLGPALPFLKDGRLLALAVGIPRRSPVLPDVPALVEVVPGYEKDGSYALLAPARTPRPILNQISKQVARTLNLPEVKQQLDSIGFVPAPTSPEEHDQILRAQIESFSKIVRIVGLRTP